ncbi:MAG: HAD family hydrolase [Myxococcaceae bacterium]
MRTAVFDMLGTFFSLEPLRQRLSAMGAPDCTLEAWFAEATRDHIALSHAGDYVPYSEILAAALPRTLLLLGKGSQDRSRQEQVLKGLNMLNPAEGAQAACVRLVEAGWRLVALTNSGEDYTRALLDRAGVLERFDEVLSADRLQTSKPHPDVYAMAHAEPGRECWMISAQGWDIAGARRAGMRTVWLSKREKCWLEALPRPDLEVPDVATATQALLRLSGVGAGAAFEQGAIA